jgi:site-specific DNA-cytosine methylase
LCQPVANCLTQRMYKGINTTLDEGQTPIVTIGGGFDAAQPIPYDLGQITSPVNRQNRKPGDPCHTLARDNAAHAAVAIQDVRAVEKAQNGRGWNDDGSAYTVDTHATQGVAVAIQGTVIGRSETAGPQGSGADVSGAMFTLTKTDVHAVAIGLDEEQNARVDGFGTLKARMEGGGFEGTVMTPAMQVRRLTPVECERLQGFPDGHTNIPWRGKPESPDGPRYKALGNSMAVPVMSWIGKRINEVNKL